jgi:hypothetical protein
VAQQEEDSMYEMNEAMKRIEAPSAAPEEIVRRLREVRAVMGTLSPLTAAQKKTLRNGLARSEEVLHAQISLAATEPAISGMTATAERLHNLDEAANRWTAVESELNAMLVGVQGANLIRRYLVASLASRSAQIGRVLARDPEHNSLLPFVQNVRALNRLARRRRSARPEASETPAEAETERDAA